MGAKVPVVTTSTSFAAGGPLLPHYSDHILSRNHDGLAFAYLFVYFLVSLLCSHYLCDPSGSKKSQANRKNSDMITLFPDEQVNCETNIIKKSILKSPLPQHFFLKIHKRFHHRL